jgi:hypothetical protein
MFALVKGQPVVGAPGYVVATGGNFGEHDLVECAAVDQPDIATCQFPAWMAAGVDAQVQQDGQSAILTRLQFRFRFTLPERIAIDAMNLPPEQQAVVRTIMRDFDAATEIHLNNPDVVAGVRAFEQFGLIAQGRADEILRIT